MIRIGLIQKTRYDISIISIRQLSENEKTSLLQVLERRKGAIAWKMSDIKGISPSYCTHKILMEDDYKQVIQPQRHLNPKVQDVVIKEIVKLLDSGLIYLISDCLWVSPIHVVPKKGGMTIVLNDNNELIPSRTVTEWRVCIDYRKLNDATRKDHFPLPFIDQMLKRLCGNECYCFLDGFLGFFQIPISPEDQENTTFTCPYGTFAYRRMPFGLCNAPAIFQRCMMAIFHDMVEDFMKVFMDDFSVFSNSFDCCLANLDRMLARWSLSVILDMPEDSRVPIILGRPFLETTRAMIDVFNKKITLRVGDDERTGKTIDQSDLEYCESTDRNNDDDSDSKNPIRRINSVNTPYQVAQDITEHDEVKSEHLYLANANEIDEKKPELKNLPQHLEYAYLYGDKSFPVIISSKLSENEKMSLLQVLEKRNGAVAWKMSDIKGIRFFQIPIAPEDQEKTTFTCPYGTFAYQRMPFGLCNAPATFQRCMTAIFHDMVEDLWKYSWTTSRYLAILLIVV
ncbi:reverse transcriptase domain-containing protein [Tanacetum coccineum]